MILDTALLFVNICTVCFISYNMGRKDECMEWGALVKPMQKWSRQIFDIIDKEGSVTLSRKDTPQDPTVH